MNYKNNIKKIGFKPEENSLNIFSKTYQNGYVIRIDFEKERFNYGNKIKAESETTQNFSQAENWVVLECVNRLLEKGYNPEDITLEKTFPSGHGHSGRLDIFVEKDGKAFLMIECKTWGKEFEKEYKNLQKNGGQLFTYFQNNTNTEFLMLYASSFIDEKIVYKNEIIKIEDNYRTAGNIEDVFNRWNKVSNQNGIFDDWVEAYNFQNKLLTKKELKSLNEEDSGFIFHEFLSILRKHSVSDKPNAFNKIFNLFLAKIYDEKKRPNDELDFQWREKKDTSVEFQIRLINLYKEGMFAFLEKEVAGISDDDFKHFPPEKIEAQKKKWLMFNNVFAIKEVIDNESFDDNQRVLKEVVELLYKYQIRYPRRQQHLSDFFERLLTTGLKQEVGQFFTPPPITKFIIKSLPVEYEIKKTLDNPVAELPAVIDYAVGSGHFITEMLEEYQTIIDNLDTGSLYPDVEKDVQTWVSNKYVWASKYIYGVDKDYRLVKVAKVGCYFYGDGLAQIIHGDGLDNFKNSKSYRGLLRQKEDHPNNGKFSFVISNPPYSVSSFKSDLKNINADQDFELFKYLTDKSSEIECLFVERTKQLLKEGGIAGIVLPSSILSNTGIYTKTREIILKDFDIISITELGSGTFMATGTNTVVFFLKRRKNAFAEDIREKVNNAFTNSKDVTINGIENPISKYIAHVWEGISFDDYKTLLKKQPNNVIGKHEIYQEYKKKIKAKNESERLDKIIALEKEKCFYFILAYTQKVVLVKTGSKKEELKQFLGYGFSERRGSEGIHPIQGGKNIDECTSLFANEDNSEKANYYIKKAFTENKFDLEIHEHLRKNISYQNLVDMLTFDRVDFEKNISVSNKKKIKIESKWEIVKIEDVSEEIINGSTPSKQDYRFWENNDIPWLTIPDFPDRGLELLETPKFTSKYSLKMKKIRIVPKNSVLISCTATIGKVAINKIELSTNQQINAIVCKDKIIPYYLGVFLNVYGYNLINLTSNAGVQHVNLKMLGNFKIPLPPKDIQEKIITEIKKLEKQEREVVDEIDKLKKEVNTLITDNTPNKKPISFFLDSLNPSKSNVIKDLPLETKVSFLKMEDVSNDARVINLQTRELNQVKTGFTFFQEEDVLFAKITPCTENGKGALVPKLKNNVGFGSTEFYVLRANKLMLPRLLFYITKSKNFRIEAEKNMTGASGHRRVPKSFVEGYQIPVFSTQDQQKIVSEIEKIETKIIALEKEIELIPQQKKTVLKKYL